MSLLRNAIKSHVSLRAMRPNHGLPSLLRESSRLLSTEAEAPPSSSGYDSQVDPFLQTTNNGVVYARLQGITRFTLKSDIINVLEGCNLKPDDIKVNYNHYFMPLGMMVQFPSDYAFSNALKELAKKGRVYKLDRVNRSDWDMIMPYNGKTVLLQNIPRNAVPEDVERFLSGCEYEPSSIQIFMRMGFADDIKAATVRFPSQTQAMNAFIKKNRGFCLNNQISVCVLR